MGRKSAYKWTPPCTPNCVQWASKWNLWSLASGRAAGYNRGRPEPAAAGWSRPAGVKSRPGTSHAGRGRAGSAVRSGGPKSVPKSFRGCFGGCRMAWGGIGPMAKMLRVVVWMSRLMVWRKGVGTGGCGRVLCMRGIYLLGAHQDSIMGIYASLLVVCPPYNIPDCVCFARNVICLSCVGYIGCVVGIFFPPYDLAVLVQSNGPINRTLPYLYTS